MPLSKQRAARVRQRLLDFAAVPVRDLQRMTR